MQQAIQQATQLEAILRRLSGMKVAGLSGVSSSGATANVNAATAAMTRYSAAARAAAVSTPLGQNINVGKIQQAASAMEQVSRSAKTAGVMQIRADTSGLRKASSEISKIRSEASKPVTQKIKADTTGLSGGIRSAISSIPGMGMIGNLVTGTTMGLAYWGFGSALQGVSSVIGSGWAYNESAQMTKVALAQMFKNQGQAPAKAQQSSEELYGWVFKTAAETPYQTADLSRYTKELMAWRFNVDEAKKWLVRLGDVGAVMDWDTGQFQQTIYALGQIKTKGKLQAMEVRQLAEHGIPVWEALADEYGFKGEDKATKFRKYAEEQGPDFEIPWEVVNRRVGEYLDVSYGGMGKEVGLHTLKGLESTVKDMFSQMMGSIEKPLTDAAQNTLIPGLIAVTNKIKTWADEGFDPLRAGEGVAGWFNSISDSIKNTDWRNVMSGAGDYVGQALEGFFADVNLGEAVINVGTAVIEGLGGFIEGMLGGASKAATKGQQEDVFEKFLGGYATKEHGALQNLELSKYSTYPMSEGGQLYNYSPALAQWRAAKGLPADTALNSITNDMIRYSYNADRGETSITIKTDAGYMPYGKVTTDKITGAQYYVSPGGQTSYAPTAFMPGLQGQIQPGTSAEFQNPAFASYIADAATKGYRTTYAKEKMFDESLPKDVREMWRKEFDRWGGEEQGAKSMFGYAGQVINVEKGMSLEDRKKIAGTAADEQTKWEKETGMSYQTWKEKLAREDPYIGGKVKETESKLDSMNVTAAVVNLSGSKMEGTKSLKDDQVPKSDHWWDRLISAAKGETTTTKPGISTPADIQQGGLFGWIQTELMNVFGRAKPEPPEQPPTESAAVVSATTVGIPKTEEPEPTTEGEIDMTASMQSMMTEMVTKISEAIKNAEFTPDMSGLNTFITEILNKFKSSLENAENIVNPEALTTFTTEFSTKLYEKIKTAAEQINIEVSPLNQAGQAVTQKIAEKISNASLSFSTAPIDAAAASVVAKIAARIAAANVPAVPAASAPAAAPAPRSFFQGGGIVDQPQLAVVGEGGEKEAIVPEHLWGLPWSEVLPQLPGYAGGYVTPGTTEIPERGSSIIEYFKSQARSLYEQSGDRHERPDFGFDAFNFDTSILDAIKAWFESHKLSERGQEEHGRGFDAYRNIFAEIRAAMISIIPIADQFIDTINLLRNSIADGKTAAEESASIKENDLGLVQNLGAANMPYMNAGLGEGMGGFVESLLSMFGGGGAMPEFGAIGGEMPVISPEQTPSMIDFQSILSQLSAGNQPPAMPSITFSPTISVTGGNGSPEEISEAVRDKILEAAAKLFQQMWASEFAATGSGAYDVHAN